MTKTLITLCQNFHMIGFSADTGLSSFCQNQGCKYLIVIHVYCKIHCEEATLFIQNSTFETSTIEPKCDLGSKEESLAIRVVVGTALQCALCIMGPKTNDSEHLIAIN